MAGRGSKNAQRSRAETERARLHAARMAWHHGQIKRRIRDNTIAGVAGGLIVVAAFTSQSVHAAVAGPDPEPTATSTTGPLENPFSGLFSEEPPTD